MRPAASAAWTRTFRLSACSACDSTAPSYWRPSERARRWAIVPTTASSTCAGACAARAAHHVSAAARLQANGVRYRMQALRDVGRHARERALVVQGDQSGFRGGEEVGGSGALDDVAEHDPARGQVANPTLDAHDVVVARGLAVADAYLGHRQKHAALLHVLVGHPGLPKVFRAGHVQP